MSSVGPTGSAGWDDPTRFGTQAFYAAIGRAFVAMCAVVPILAIIEFVDERLGNALDAFAGIRPRQVSGLDGILLAPLVHDGFDHLLANSAPLVLLGTLVLAAGTRRFLAATLAITLFSGLGVWWFTPPTYLVIGSSGVIFGWLGFLLLRGIVERSWWNLGVALVVGLLYGYQLVALLPIDSRVSWQGHLFGFTGGLAAAIIFRRRSELRQLGAAGAGAGGGVGSSDDTGAWLAPPRPDPDAPRVDSSR